MALILDTGQSVGQLGAGDREPARRVAMGDWAHADFGVRSPVSHEAAYSLRCGGMHIATDMQVFMSERLRVRALFGTVRSRVQIRTPRLKKPSKCGVFVGREGQGDWARTGHKCSVARLCDAEKWP